MKKDIRSLTLDELIEDFSKIGLKKYKAEQVFKWISKEVSSFDEMTDLSKDGIIAANNSVKFVKNIKHKFISIKN